MSHIVQRPVLGSSLATFPGRFGPPAHMPTQMLPSASASGPRRKLAGWMGGMNSVHAPVVWSNRAILPPFHSASQMLSNGSIHAPYGVAACVGIRYVAALRVAG